MRGRCLARAAPEAPRARWLRAATAGCDQRNLRESRRSPSRGRRAGIHSSGRRWMSYLTDDPIDGAQLARHALRSTDGAVVLFEGVVRDNNEGKPVESIFYDAYRPM